MKNQLILQNISKYFDQDSNKISIFKDLSYQFEQSTSYALVGTSGTGKSTLIHMLSGVDQPSTGTIAWNDNTISQLPLEQRIQILQKNIGLVFQQPLLIQELSVIENIMLKQLTLGSIKQEHIERAKQLLKEVHLLEKASCTPNILSGGQQQRVAILRALFHPPQFLLADEPTGNLDEATGNKVIQLIFDYQKKYGMGLILSTHDMNIAQQCDVIVKIENQSLHPSCQ